SRGHRPRLQLRVVLPQAAPCLERDEHFRRSTSMIRRRLDRRRETQWNKSNLRREKRFLHPSIDGPNRVRKPYQRHRQIYRSIQTRGQGTPSDRNESTALRPTRAALDRSPCSLPPSGERGRDKR